MIDWADLKVGPYEYAGYEYIGAGFSRPLLLFTVHP